MNHAFRLVSLLVLALGAGCTTSQTAHLLPSYGRAIQMVDPEKPAPPKVFVQGRCSDHFWDELVPYFTHAANREGSGFNPAFINSRVSNAVWHMPDAVYYLEGQSQIVGSVGQYWGMGVATSSPVISTPTVVIGYRAAPSIMPFRCDENGMVVLVRDSQACAGLVEGDTVLTFGEDSMPPKELMTQLSWPGHMRRMARNPGDKVKVVWIRPGAGRQEGQITMLANPQEFRKEADSLALEGIRDIRYAKDSKGQYYWYYPTWDSHQ